MAYRAGVSVLTAEQVGYQKVEARGWGAWSPLLRDAGGMLMALDDGEMFEGGVRGFKRSGVGFGVEVLGVQGDQFCWRSWYQ
eukprot:CAMPEP_0184318330 /NCGR_PEP_ID=MMETSP1049-20130417/101999_1 /TAXON_ID=77928 /ORGANISM="Proteomonas sulcata, Strain CCMP704" /LENGTH=81 /DNA_ID=CAMNT_0026638065 /DNA_START=63 /DNA_END=306 /DNA_ORIENTATION=-